MTIAIRSTGKARGLFVVSRVGLSLGMLVSTIVWLVAPGLWAESTASADQLAGQSAELSAWAYTYRADREVQEKPEANFVLRRLARLDQTYRPVSLLLSQDSEKSRATKPPYPGLLAVKDLGELGPMLPPPDGVLHAAMLWEGRMQLNRVELEWPKNGAPPAAANVEVRVYPSPFGWFGWQRDQRIAASPEISTDGTTWVYRGDWNGVDMVAVFVKESDPARVVPQIRAYGPERWQRLNLEVEWGFQTATEKADYDGRVEGYFGIVEAIAPLPDDVGTKIENATTWKSASGGGGGRRGVSLSVLYIRPTSERVGNLPVFPYGHPRDTRITIYTKSGSFTFLTRDLEQGPILAPEFGFFVHATDGAALSQTRATDSSSLLLSGKRDELLGCKDLHGWGIAASQGVALGAMVNLFWERKAVIPDTPWLVGNATAQPLNVQGISFPSRGIVVHPGPDCDVAVGWSSPLDGRVRLEGSVVHAHPNGGDGVAWSMVGPHEPNRGMLAHGAIDRGGQQVLPAAEVAVRKGDLLTLVIGRRDNHTCDSTAVTWMITELGGPSRQWDLAKDVVDHLSEGNPCADSWGNSGVWSFLQLSSQPVNSPPISRPSCQARSAREFLAALDAAKVPSIRQMTRAHREATWDEAMREIKLPLYPPDTTWPASKPTDDPPMSVEVPEQRWQEAWRLGTSQLRKGELSYMDLALEAPRPIHDMDLAGLHESAATWLDSFLQRPGTMADGDFPDGTGNFCLGTLFHNTALTDVPGHPTYELIHNGGTGRILNDLAEHFFLTGDREWFQKYQSRMQAAADWIIRQRAVYMKEVPNRQDLWGAGLHPPAHIADCAWGYSEWKWYTSIDAWNCQGLRRFAEAMRECDPDNAERYLAEAEQYRAALLKAVNRAITLAPVMPTRNGTYRSYIPPLLYMRGPSIEQVVQISMTDQDWSLQALDAIGGDAVNDVRVDGHLDVCEDLLALNTTHLHGGNRYALLMEKRQQRGVASPDDWFWGGFAPQLGYTSLANIYLRRDEVSSFLRQWVNNYAAFVVPIPDYCFVEHFMNQASPDYINLVLKGDRQTLVGNPGYRNGHALSYFMEQYRNLLVWEEGSDLWLAKATPRHWLEQGKKISVHCAPTYFGEVAYAIDSDVEHGQIQATVEMPARKEPRAVLLRLRHPEAIPIKSVTVNGNPWTDFDASREVIVLKDLTGAVTVRVNY